MKILLLNILIFLGISKVYAGSSQSFLKTVPKLESAERGAEGCSGCKECGGTERPNGGGGSAPK